jgi:hypothetical protein
MQTKIAVILGLILIGSVCTTFAQTTTGPTNGPAWSLTPEQRAARQQQVQTTLADLRAKRDNGTITANEKVWLERMEQAGGLCVNGVPRGGGRGAGFGPRAQMGTCPFVTHATAATVTSAPGGGRGRGFGMGWRGGRGRGQGNGLGLRDGTGPRSQNGTCPWVNPTPSN